MPGREQAEDAEHAGARREADAEREEGVAQVLAPAEAPLEADAVRDADEQRQREQHQQQRQPRRGPWRSRAARAPWSSASAGRRSAPPPKPRPRPVSACAARRASGRCPPAASSPPWTPVASRRRALHQSRAARKARAGLGAGRAWDTLARRSADRRVRWRWRAGASRRRRGRSSRCLAGGARGAAGGGRRGDRAGGRRLGLDRPRGARDPAPGLRRGAAPSRPDARHRRRAGTGASRSATSNGPGRCAPAR